MVIEGAILILVEVVLDKVIDFVTTRSAADRLRRSIQQAIEQSLDTTLGSFPNFQAEVLSKDFIERRSVQRELAKLVTASAGPDIDLLCEEWKQCHGQPLQGDIGLVLSKFVVEAGQRLSHIDELIPVLTLRRTNQISRSQAEGFRELKNELAGMKAPIAEDESGRAPAEGKYDARIDTCRDLHRDNRPSAAQSSLSKLEAEIRDETVSNRLRFRLHTLMGACALTQGDIDESIRRFTQAHRLQPGHPKAQANRALAHFLSGELEQAVALADRVLAKEEHGTNARAVRTWALAQQRRHTDLEDLVEEDYLDDKDYVQALGMVFLQAERYDHAEKYLRLSIAQDESNIQSKMLLADTIIQHNVPSVEFYLYVQVGMDWKDTLHEALELADQVVRQAQKGDNAALEHEGLLLRSRVRAHLGDVSGAKEDCDSVLKESPIHERALYNRALVAMNNGESEEALQFLERLPAERRKDRSVGFAMGRCYIETNKPDVALTVLDEIEEQCDDLISHTILRADAFVRLGKRDEAISRRQNLLSRRSDDPTSLRAAAAISHLLGDPSGEIDALLLAYDAANGIGKTRVAAELGLVHFHERKFADAVSWFERVGDRVYREPLLVRAYATALYNTRQYKQAHGVARNARQAGVIDAILLDIEAFVVEALGDLATAESLTEQLVELEPDVAAHRINLIRVRLRAGDTAGAQDVLGRLREDAVTDPLEMAQLAEILDFMGQRQRAILLAYRAVREGPDIAQTHLTYFHLFFSRAQEIEGLDPEQVAPDTAVLLKSGEKRYWVKILDSVAPRGNWEYQADSEPARRLLGHRVGDVVVMRSGMLEELQYEVIEIQSVLVRALQESLDEFGTRFPTNPAIQRMDAVGGDPSKMLIVVAGFSDRAERLLQFYQTGYLTIEALADLLNRDRIDVQRGISLVGDCHILSSTGMEVDQRKEKRCVPGSDSVTMGLSALVTLESIDLLGGFTQRFRTIAVPQRLVDELATRWQEKKRWGSRRRHFLSYHEGTWQFSEVTTEVVEREIGHAERLLAFVKQHCEVVPLDAEYSDIVLDPKGPSDLIGSVSLASLLVAKQTGTPIYSDDLALRRLARSEYGLDSFWTHSLLGELRERAIITREKYEDACIALIVSNYHYVPVDGRILLRALKADESYTDRQVLKVLGVLRGPSTTEDTAIEVASELIRDVWLDSGLALRRELIVDRVLSVLVAGRNLALVSHKLRKALGSRLQLAPVQFQQVILAVNQWLRVVGPTVASEIFRGVM